MKSKIFILFLCLNSVVLIAQEKKYDLIMHGSIVARNLSSDDCHKEMLVKSIKEGYASKCDDCKCVPTGTYSETTPIEQLGIVAAPAILANEFGNVMIDALTGFDNNTGIYSEPIIAEREATSRAAVRSGGNTRVATIPQKEPKSDFSKAKGGYGVMENLGKNYGLDFSKYVPKGLWDKASKNMGAMSSKEISQFNSGFDKFMSDLFKSDKDLQLINDKLLIDLGIDLAEIATSTMLDIIKISSGGNLTLQIAVAKGFIKTAAELGKAYNNGKDMKDYKVWLNATISGAAAAGSSFVNTGSKTLDIGAKASITTAGEVLKGENSKEVVQKTAYSGVKNTTTTITGKSAEYVWETGANEWETAVVVAIVKGVTDAAFAKGEYIHKNLKNDQNKD